MAEENGKTVEYNDGVIQTLSALEHIRKRPGMYIGRLGDGSHRDDGIYIMLKEIVDNSVDEFIMGKGRRIDIKIDGETVSVRDYGRGIPLGKLADCVSVMNTGGKYNDDVFQFSVGLNGVGTKAVNALSQDFVAQSFRDGKMHRVEFCRGKIIADTEGDTPERDGTYISFVPDRQIFPTYNLNLEYIERRMWMYAYLNSGLSLYFNDQRFYSQNGLKDLLEVEGGDEQLYEVIHYRTKTLEFALTHSNNYGESCFSFVNGQFTNDGGTHLSAFKEGVLKAINEFSGKNYKADDVRDGMVGAIAIKIKEPVFESQTKNKLGNTDIRGPIVAEVKDQIVDFLHKNRELADILLDKVSRNEQLHKQITDAKKQAKEVSKKMSLRIPKLHDCKFHRGEKDRKGNPLPETMIFLTEGDSAAGSFEMQRDVNTQAIFALKGKPLNCFGEKREKIYQNDELFFIMQALNIENEIDNLRYDKVIIATDADVDGMHIRNLLITYFLTYFEQLVMSGHLYILETPLYRVKSKMTKKDTDEWLAKQAEKVAMEAAESELKTSRKKSAADKSAKLPKKIVETPKFKMVYCYSDKERDAALAEVGKGSELTRFKGLGEISPHEIGEFIHENIKLLPVTLDHLRNIPELLEFYMGNNTPSRKDYIMENLEISVYE